MQRSPARVFILWLAAIGLLIQGLGASNAAGGGMLLCVGCDAGGLSLVAAEPQSGAFDCCADAPARPTPAEPTSPREHEEGDCNCVAVPLDGAPPSPAPPIQPDRASEPAPACSAVPVRPIIEAPGPSSRAGPHARADTAPLSRRTVLRL
jgi:hypothetical protein